MKAIILFSLLFSFGAQANAEKDSLIDFSSIRDVLKKDHLESEVAKKVETAQKQKTLARNSEKAKFNIPEAPEFWPFMSELWLVKNATLLKWDFQKPDYGLSEAIGEFFERMGLFEKRFKLLLLNSPNICHAILPSMENEFIIILSVPFIRTLDLSKPEIALLVFEDYIRLRQGHFINFVKDSEVEGFIGKNFDGKAIPTSVTKKVLAKYDELLYDKGFSFQQQFEVTNEVNQYLKNDLSLWNLYLKMLEKLDGLVKTNMLYQNYVKIYPSPEMQMGWIKPKKEL